MCGCGKVRVPAFLQKQRQQNLMQRKQQQQRNKLNMPQGQTTAQVRPIQKKPVQKKPPMNRQQMMQKRRQALRKLNQMRQKRKNMNSAFDHRYYLRY